MKGNVINLNTLHLNSVRLNGIGKVQSVSLKGGSTEDPVFPPVEPPVEPEPTPTYTLSASVINGKVSATRNGSAVNLPFTANEGDVIVVSVTPNDGYEFNGWADGNTDNPRSITMTADVALSAECSEVVQPPVGNYIQFEDAEVERVLMSKGVSSDGVGITMEDAASVTKFPNWLANNTTIKTFNELQYFSGLKRLEYRAFISCTSLEEVSLPCNATDVGQGAFQSCTSLKKVVMPSSCKTITKEAFAMSGVSDINLENVENIEIYAFSQCKSLSLADIGSSIISIGSYAFYKDSQLKKIIVRAATPPSMDGTAFRDVADFVIYVPDASLEAYRTATNWNQYADRIHPLSEIEGGHITTFEGLIGAYTFEGRSNEDADRDIVEDKSGYNNTLTLKSMQWGFIHNTLPDLIREGFWDDALWLSQSGYGEITLPNGLTDFTIIAKRYIYAASSGRGWSPLVGTGKSSGKGLFWLEYNADNGIYTTQVNGLSYTISSLESEVTWLTNTHYNGHRLTGTQGNNVHDGMVYINRFRGDVSTTKFQKIYAVYLFNRQLSPSEIEAFIKEKIDASYVLPTIEQ